MIRGKQKRLQVAGYRLQVTALRGETGTETLKLDPARPLPTPVGISRVKNLVTCNLKTCNYFKCSFRNASAS